MKSFFFFIPILIAFNAWASLEIPNSMTTGDRKKVVEILGFSSAAKILGNPYPLGGYSGIEVGYTTEVISTGEMSRLGSKPSTQSETTFSTLTLGKGLYHNVDIFLQFTPFSQTEAITGFGGQLRWGFYQAEYLPAHLSLVISGNNTNFQNKINTTTQGTDLVAGFSVQDLTLYTGVGLVRSIGTFVGGAGGVTSDANTATEDLSTSHYLAGINVKFSKMFLAMQLDRYTQSTYSAKLGTRF